MDHQRLGIADVGKVRKEFQPLDEATARLSAALYVEAEDRPRPLGQQALRHGMVGMLRQLGRGDALDSRIGFQEGDHLARVLAVPGDAQRQGLQSLQQVERRLRRHAAAEIAHTLGAGAHDEGVRAKLLGKVDAVIACIGFGQRRELPRGLPVEAAGLHDHAADRHAMPANELGS